MGDIKRSSSQVPGMLAVNDVIDKWNVINPYHPVSKQNVPSDWGLQEVEFYLAPVGATIGPVTYKPGFSVAGVMELLSMYLTVGITCTSVDCDFYFKAGFSLSTFEKMIWHEITHSDLDTYRQFANETLDSVNNASYTFFSLHDVQLTDWSQKNIAYNVHPQWYLSMTILNKPKQTTFDVRQYELSHSFHVFFVTWLKHLF